MRLLSFRQRKSWNAAQMFVIGIISGLPSKLAILCERQEDSISNRWICQREVRSVCDDLSPLAQEMLKHMKPTLNRLKDKESKIVWPVVFASMLICMLLGAVVSVNVPVLLKHERSDVVAAGLTVGLFIGIFCWACVLKFLVRPMLSNKYRPEVLALAPTDPKFWEAMYKLRWQDYCLLRDILGREHVRF